MHPILLKIGPFSVYSYGFMVSAGFLLAVYLVLKDARPLGFDPDDVIDIALYMLIGGLIGARVAYVLLNFDYFRRNPLEIFYLSRGGLVYYGAFLGGLLAVVACIFRKKLSFWNVADLFAPYIALGQAVGRIGCFLNGCCYGRAVSGNFSLGVAFPESTVIRHPTQVYSSLILLVLFLALKAFRPRRRFAGEVFIIYCAAYSFQRFFIEFLRGDNPPILLNMTASQVMSAVIFTASLFVWSIFFARWKST